MTFHLDTAAHKIKKRTSLKAAHFWKAEGGHLQPSLQKSGSRQTVLSSWPVSSLVSQDDGQCCPPNRKSRLWDIPAVTVGMWQNVKRSPSSQGGGTTHIVQTATFHITLSLTPLVVCAELLGDESAHHPKPKGNYFLQSKFLQKFPPSTCQVASGQSLEQLYSPQLPTPLALCHTP